MSDSLSLALDVARRAAVDASRLCLQVLAESPSSPEAMAKLGKEPVTVADYGSQALILRRLADAFPSDVVVAEEGSEHMLSHAGSGGAGQIARLVADVAGTSASIEEVCEWIDHSGEGGRYTWAVDPIDGTKGFLRRDQFAVAIGILEDGEPVGGVLGCPHMSLNGDDGVVVWAGRGLGAHVFPLSGGESTPVAVSAAAEASTARVLGSVESGHGDPALVESVIDIAKLGGGWVRLDSQVKYAAVAADVADVYVRPRNRPDYRERIWDHAAGAAIVCEAGGVVTDLDGRELDFGLGSRLENNRGVLATNGTVHDLVLNAICDAEAG